MYTLSRGVKDLSNLSKEISDVLLYRFKKITTKFHVSKHPTPRTKLPYLKRILRARARLTQMSPDARARARASAGTKHYETGLERGRGEEGGRETDTQVNVHFIYRAERRTLGRKRESPAAG